MKRMTRRLLVSFCGLMVSQMASLTAGYPVYPPTSSIGVAGLIFADSENEKMLRSCRAESAVCARFYVLPRYISVKENEETGAKMVSHGLMTGSGGRLSALSIYNLTLQPVFATGKSDSVDPLAGLQDIQSRIIHQIVPSFMAAKKITGLTVLPQQIELAPLPVADAQFIVTGLPFGDESSSDSSVEEPDPVPPLDPQTKAPILTAEEIAAKSEKIGKEVHYTKFYAPKWQGDMHSLGQPFSVSVQGKVWNIEPAFKRMMTSSSGNAVIGTMSFRFRALAMPIKMKVSCNLNTFQEVVRSTQKQWHHYRYKSWFKTVERFSNEEWNAIRSSLKISDYCSVSDFKDTTLPADQAMDQVKDLLFDRLLTRAFNAVTSAGEPVPVEAKDPRYTHFESKASIDASAQIDLELTQESVVWFSSDLDFQGGAISEDQLDPAHWTFCNHWSRANPSTRKCEEVCEPFYEVYWKRHPKASAPATGNISEPVCVRYEDL